MDSSPALAERLAVARRLRDLTQAELAAAANVPQSQVSRIERGAVADPGFATFAQLARALDVSLAALAAESTNALMQELAMPQQDGVVLGRSALAAAPAKLWREDPAKSSPHLAVYGRVGTGQSYIAKLELLRQMYHGAPVSVIDIANDFVGLFDPYQRAIIGPPGHGRVPLLTPPAGVTARAHADTIVGWLLSVLGIAADDIDKLTSLRRALGRVYTRWKLRPDDTINADSFRFGTAPTFEDLVDELDSNATWTEDEAGERDRLLVERLRGLFGEDEGAYRDALGGRDLGDERVQHWSLAHLNDQRMQAHLAALLLQRVMLEHHAAETAELRIVAMQVTRHMLQTPLLREMLEFVAAQGRRFDIALSLVLDEGDIEDASTLLKQCATHIVTCCSTSTMPALTGVIGLDERAASQVIGAPYGEGLLVSGNERGMVSLTEGVSEQEQAALRAQRPPLPDIEVEVDTELPFPGYSSMTSVAWAVYDNSGRVLLVDSPNTQGTSVTNASEMALAAFNEYRREAAGSDAATEAWVYDRNSGPYLLNPETGAPADSQPDDDVRERPFVRVAMAALRRAGWVTPRW